MTHPTRDFNRLDRSFHFVIHRTLVKPRLGTVKEPYREIGRGDRINRPNLFPQHMPVAGDPPCLIRSWFVTRLQTQDKINGFSIEDLIAVHAEHPVIARQIDGVVHLHTMHGIGLMMRSDAIFLANRQGGVVAARVEDDDFIGNHYQRRQDFAQ